MYARNVVVAASWTELGDVGVGCVLETLREQHRVWGWWEFLGVERGLWSMRKPHQGSLFLDRCFVVDVLSSTDAVLNDRTSLYICTHTDTTVVVPTNESLLPRRPETSCWQRYRGHLPTRISGTVTTRMEGHREKGFGAYCSCYLVMFICTVYLSVCMPPFVEAFTSRLLLCC